MGDNSNQYLLMDEDELPRLIASIKAAQAVEKHRPEEGRLTGREWNQVLVAMLHAMYCAAKRY